MDTNTAISKLDEVSECLNAIEGHEECESILEEVISFLQVTQSYENHENQTAPKRAKKVQKVIYV